MKKILILFNIAVVLILSSCEYYVDRLYFGTNELRENAKTFVEENVNSAEIYCYVEESVDNIAKFEEKNGEVFTEEFAREAFLLLTDDVFSELECFESHWATFPRPIDMIVDGYYAEKEVQISIPDDTEEAYIDYVIFYFDSTKEVKIAKLYITKDDVSYICDLRVE